MSCYMFPALFDKNGSFAYLTLKLHENEVFHVFLASFVEKWYFLLVFTKMPKRFKLITHLDLN